MLDPRSQKIMVGVTADEDVEAALHFAAIEARRRRVGVHLALLYLTLNVLGAAFAAAQATAVVGAMTFNFALNNRFTYRDQQLKGLAWVGGLLSFYLVCSIGAIGNVGIGSLVYEQFHGWWMAGIAGAIVGSVWNYVASGWLTWTKR